MNRIPTWAWIALAIVVAMVLWTVFAYAQEAVIVENPDVVVVPWAVWLEAGKDTIIGIAVIVFGWLLRYLPGQAVAAIRIFRVEQMLIRALDNAINSVAGANRDKPLTVDVGNEVLAKALQYVIDKAPATLVEWMGGRTNIAEMLIARMKLSSSAAVVKDSGKPVIVQASSQAAPRQG